MKKAKIMLVAIAVLATVGGALAFKANTALNQDYCFLTIDDADGGVCQIPGDNFKTTGAQFAHTTYWYTITTDLTECDQVNCLKSTRFTTE